MKSFVFFLPPSYTDIIYMNTSYIDIELTNSYHLYAKQFNEKKKKYTYIKERRRGDTKKSFWHDDGRM